MVDFTKRGKAAERSPSTRLYETLDRASDKGPLRPAECWR